MPQCEYRRFNLFNLPRRIDQIHLLNDLRRAGWHLFDITAANVAILKREVSESAPAKPNHVRLRRLRTHPLRPEVANSCIKCIPSPVTPQSPQVNLGQTGRAVAPPQAAGT
jgi:hypothetical protein